MLRQEYLLCVQCQIELPVNSKIKSRANEVKTVFAGRLPLLNANTFLDYSKKGITQNLIHGLKYQDREDVGEYLGSRFAQELEGIFLEPVVIIIPVPLHPKKEKSRGYNQCLSIANGMAAAMDCEVRTDVVRRNLSNPSQTKLNRAKRWDNVKGIFEVYNPQPIAGKHVLLIDDTLTTGATLESCGGELLKVENTKLSIAALAHAV